MRTKQIRPNLSTAIALAALFVALGSSATAAIVVTRSNQLGKNVVTSAKIKNRSIRGVDIKNRSITAKKLRGQAAGPRGERGSQGPAGPQGPPGADGVNGRDGEDGRDGLRGEDCNPIDHPDWGCEGPPGPEGERGPVPTLYAATISGADGAAQVEFVNKKLTELNVERTGQGNYEITLHRKDPMVAAVVTNVLDPSRGPVAATVEDLGRQGKVVRLVAGNPPEDTDFYVLLIGEKDP